MGSINEKRIPVEKFRKTHPCTPPKRGLSKKYLTKSPPRRGRGGLSSREGI
jgi:hypothetical protein